MKLYLSRQHYYYSGQSVVELSTGGKDYAGSDMLCKRYAGEGQEYSNPVEAVSTAIDICRQWRIDGCKTAKIAIGNSHGMGIELESTTFKHAKQWAKRILDTLPRCAHCGDILGDEVYSSFDLGDDKYCSEYCIETAMAKTWYTAPEDCSD